jgi:hypothetical protein
MRSRAVWMVPVVVGSLLAGPVLAQLYPGRPTTDRNQDTGKAFQFNIKRRSINGSVKSLDSEKKILVVASGKDKGLKEVPVDVGPAVIKAGKGSATFADIQVGDKITVYGESTVQGGLRAMEITLPKERMSIAPPSKPKKVKRDKKAEEAAKKTENGEEEKKEEPKDP